MPVGRVNDRNPDGHSGQRKLHDVVGSIDSDIGPPAMRTSRPPDALARR
jgi:hypothetical protein